MSEYKVYKCDRCKEEFTDDKNLVLVLEARTYSVGVKNEEIKNKIGKYQNKHIDLCEKCAKSFIGFIDPENVERTPVEDNHTTGFATDYRFLKEEDNDYWDVRLENNDVLHLPTEMSNEDFLVLTKDHSLMKYVEDFNLYFCDECKNVVTENSVRINTFPIKVDQDIKHIYVCPHCGRAYRSFVHIKAQKKE